MIAKKYIITAAAVATLVAGGVFTMVSAHEGMDTTTTAAPVNSQAHKWVVQVGPEGRALLRGTLKTVGTNSLTVTSWGGDWMINIMSDTKLMPNQDMSQFKVGDFIGVQGKVSTTGVWMIDATLVRDWTAKKVEQTARQDVREFIKDAIPKNWEGTVSNASSTMFTLTMGSNTYTVTPVSVSKIVNSHFMVVTMADIKNGDKVTVWGTLSGTEISALVVKDNSL